jgi:hypothetical protein
MDPRSRMTTAELLEQFEWGQRVFQEMIDARRAAAEIKGLRIQMDKVKAGLKQDRPALLNTVNSADEKLRVMELGGEANRQNGLDGLSHSFTVALGAIESADRVPPSQVIALYEESARTLKTRLSEWQAFKQKAVPTVNQQLRDAGLGPLEIVRVEQQSQATVSQ